MFKLYYKNEPEKFAEAAKKCSGEMKVVFNDGRTLDMKSQDARKAAEAYGRTDVTVILNNKEDLPVFEKVMHVVRA